MLNIVYRGKAVCPVCRESVVASIKEDAITFQAKCQHDLVGVCLNGVTDATDVSKLVEVTFQIAGQTIELKTSVWRQQGKTIFCIAQ